MCLIERSRRHSGLLAVLVPLPFSVGLEGGSLAAGLCRALKPAEMLLRAHSFINKIANVFFNSAEKVAVKSWNIEEGSV